MSGLHTSSSIHLLERTRHQSLKAHLGALFWACVCIGVVWVEAKINPASSLLCVGFRDGDGIPIRKGSFLVL